MNENVLNATGRNRYAGLSREVHKLSIDGVDISAHVSAVLEHTIKDGMPIRLILSAANDEGKSLLKSIDTACTLWVRLGRTAPAYHFEGMTASDRKLTIDRATSSTFLAGSSLIFELEDYWVEAVEETFPLEFTEWEIAWAAEWAKRRRKELGNPWESLQQLEKRKLGALSVKLEEFLLARNGGK